ncbi:MAG: hypothetical protein QOE96_3968 [Blastocatellia bacterium]|jgi:uncharacterized protein (DUF1778 family)|nr:hypothetical protein [Blastocatellia bacterium]
MPTKRKPGRPKLPKGHAKESYIPIRVSAEERKAFERAAKASEHKTLSGWIRHSLRATAERETT